MTERLRWTLRRRLRYAGLVSLVLLGLAAMHGGTSAATSPAAHGSVPVATVATVATVDTTEHLGAHGDLEEAVRASAALPITIMAAATRCAGDHGMLMAGCLLALTGLVTLALVLLLHLSGRFPDRYLTARRHRRPLLPSRRAALARPVPRFFLCVLRT